MTKQDFTLIAVAESTINDETVQTVNARELHTFLGSKRQFSNWIAYQIEAFEFTQGVDFITINNSEYSPPRKEYHITLDMAKELAMVERNAKGREARKYFIAVEKAYYKQQPKNLTTEQILVMALESERARMALQKKLEEAQPMVDFHEEVCAGVGEFTIPNVCKTLFNGAVSDQQLRSWLKNNRWMDRRKGFNEPTSWAIQQGLMRLRLNVKIRPGHVVNVPMITAKGLALLRHLYRTGELFVATIPMERRMSAPQMTM